MPRSLAQVDGDVDRALVVDGDAQRDDDGAARRGAPLGLGARRPRGARRRRPAGRRRRRGRARRAAAPASRPARAISTAASCAPARRRSPPAPLDGDRLRAGHVEAAARQVLGLARGERQRGEQDQRPRRSGRAGGGGGAGVEAEHGGLHGEGRPWGGGNWLAGQPRYRTFAADEASAHVNGGIEGEGAHEAPRRSPARGRAVSAAGGLRPASTAGLTVGRRSRRRGSREHPRRRAPSARSRDPAREHHSASPSASRASPHHLGSSRVRRVARGSAPGARAPGGAAPRPRPRSPRCGARRRAARAGSRRTPGSPRSARRASRKRVEQVVGAPEPGRGGAEPLHPQVAVAPDHLGEQLLLGAEVVVEEPARDARRPRDVVERRAVAPRSPTQVRIASTIRCAFSPDSRAVLVAASIATERIPTSARLGRCARRSRARGGRRARRPRAARARAGAGARARLRGGERRVRRPRRRRGRIRSATTGATRATGSASRSGMEIITGRTSARASRDGGHARARRGRPRPA